VHPCPLVRAMSWTFPPELLSGRVFDTRIKSGQENRHPFFLKTL
jgi:hypothetical protein